MDPNTYVLGGKITAEGQRLLGKASGWDGRLDGCSIASE
jgi:hypothetical protein